MDTGALDFPALALGTVIALAITVAMGLAHRGDNNRRGWIVAAGLTAVLLAIGLADLLSAPPRETHLATIVAGSVLPVLGGLGMIRGTRRVRAVLRWPLVFVTTFVLLFGGLLVGATLVPRFLP